MAANDKAYQLLAHGRWFSPDSATTKTGRHDIAEILMKLALNTIKQTNKQTSTESIRILKLCLQFMDLGLRYLGPLANTSQRQVLLIVLWSLLITWPVGLYMNGKLAQVQLAAIM